MVDKMAILKGKTAVVTGSTSGIGLACARAFAGAGANIVLNGMGAQAEVEEERAAIERDFAVKAIYSPADIAKPTDVAELIALAERTYGGVDVLVNNAGIQHVSPVREFPVEKWDAVIAINLSAAFHAIRAAVSGMKKRGWGRIITTASAHSMVASPFKWAYVAAKHGIAGLTKTVALELARSKITCNCISPGYVWTPLVEKQLPRAGSRPPLLPDARSHCRAPPDFPPAFRWPAATTQIPNSQEASFESLVGLRGNWPDMRRSNTIARAFNNAAHQWTRRERHLIPAYMLPILFEYRTVTRA
jgi:3-hydroxybutyrate dehydrogenase